ncbi:MAG: L-lactate dehydrogenase complex protein LldG [Solirubrobacteraceae bacterium]|nr:L-lactate dehydrogenase complex protein LldG [Solirubrobacteraceae bacterium]
MGGALSSAREEVLGRIRRALGPAPAVPEVPREYRPAGAVAADVERFAERVADYRATVHRCDAAGLDATVRELLAGARVAVGTRPPCGLAGLDTVTEPGVAVLDTVDAVLTGCALAVAETGTLVLAGERALTLIPDRHVCVVHEDQIVAGVPDMVAALPRDAPLTLVSGPSATSDIELERVEGVHGPRRLDVVVVAGVSR